MKIIIIFIFLSNIFSQIINHELVEMAYSNIPLKIEFEIESYKKNINNVSLFYRTSKQQNYFEINCFPLQKGYFFGIIPISALDQEFVEYIIVSEFKDGSSVSYPSIDPFTNPFRVQVESINDSEFINVTSIQNQGGSVKSNALILSPIQNSNVNKDDILIALSLFSVKEPNLDKVTVILDDIDISDLIIIEDNLLTYIPENIAQGLHNVSISMENKYGIKFETVEWSFNIISSYAESQESSFKRSGKITTDVYQSVIEDDVVEYNTTNLLLRGNWDWLDLKSNVKISSLESIYEQPRNRYRLDFKTPFLILKLGDVNPEFNQYALWGTRIRGFETQLNNKYFTLKFTQGELTRAIQGESLDETMVISNLKEADSDMFQDSNGDGVWNDAENFIDLYPFNGVYDEGIEEFQDCGLDNNGNYICYGDDGWDDSFGNGEWDGPEELIVDEFTPGIWDSYGPDTIQIGRDNYTFKNTIYGIDMGVKYKNKFKFNVHFLKSRDNTQSIYNKIEGSIIHLTDELDTLVSDEAIDMNLFNIDTSIVVTDESIETIYDFSIGYNSLMENCEFIFGENNSFESKCVGLSQESCIEDPICSWGDNECYETEYRCELLSENWSGKLPQDNIVFGSDISWNLDESKMIFEGGFSFSLLNQNIWDPIFTSANLDTLSVIGDTQLDNQIAGSFEIPFEPSDYQDLFIINQSMYPLIPIDVSSGQIGLKQILHMSSLAYHYKLRMKYLNHNILLGYRQIGPDYFSLGNPNMQKNIRERTFSDKMKFFNNRMFVIFKYQDIDDGISLISETISTNKKMDLNINLYPGVGVPTFSLGIGVNTRDNGVNEQFSSQYFYEGSYYNQTQIDSLEELYGNTFNSSFVDTVSVDVSNRDYTKTIKTNILVTNQFKYYGFHNISLNITNSNKIDLMEMERGPALLEIKDYFSPASKSEAFSINLKSVFIGNVETNLSVSKNNFSFSKGDNYGEQNLSFVDLMIGLKKRKFFKSIDFGGNISFGNGLANFEQYTFKSSFIKGIYDILLLKINGEIKRKIVIADELQYYNNYQITANLSYTF